MAFAVSGRLAARVRPPSHDPVADDTILVVIAGALQSFRVSNILVMRVIIPPVRQFANDAWLRRERTLLSARNIEETYCRYQDCEGEAQSFQHCKMRSRSNSGVQRVNHRLPRGNF